MIITKRQLRKAIERSEFIPPSMKEYYFLTISAKKRWMWETELIKCERFYQSNSKCFKDYFDSSARQIEEMRQHIFKTHNTDHAV